MAMTKPTAKVIKGTHPVAGAGGASIEATGRQAVDMASFFLIAQRAEGAKLKTSW
jgi:hypothetical protein